jgi:GNAT superfamily N-acetyltransferase
MTAPMPAPAAGPRPATARYGRAEVIALTGAMAATAAEGLAPALAEIAAAAFAGPPWNEADGQAGRAVDQMLACARRRSFVLAVALAPEGPGLAGFAYGLPGWHPAILGGRPPEPADAPPFELCELAVRPSARGRGVGAALHDAILAVSGPRLRWLTTHPAARPALGLYRSRGWHTTRLVPSARDGTTRLLMTRTR